MTEIEDEKVSGTKVPMFYGEANQWKYYKRNMASYLARIGLGELLTETSGNAVLRDTDTLPPDGPGKKAARDLIKNNKKAAGILLNLIDS